MTEYLVIYEQGKNGTWHAHAADLPVFTVGDTREEAEREVRAAIAEHLEGLKMDGQPVPQIQTLAGIVRV